MHLPQDWPWQTAWTQLNDRVADPPDSRDQLTIQPAPARPRTTWNTTGSEASRTTTPTDEHQSHSPARPDHSTRSDQRLSPAVSEFDDSSTTGQKVSKHTTTLKRPIVARTSPSRPTAAHHPGRAFGYNFSVRLSCSPLAPRQADLRSREAAWSRCLRPEHLQLRVDRSTTGHSQSGELRQGSEP